jgi:hypothetical protein
MYFRDLKIELFIIIIISIIVIIDNCNGVVSRWQQSLHQYRQLTQWQQSLHQYRQLSLGGSSHYTSTDSFHLVAVVPILVQTYSDAGIKIM